MFLILNRYHVLIVLLMLISVSISSCSLLYSIPDIARQNQSQPSASSGTSGQGQSGTAPAAPADVTLYKIYAPGMKDAKLEKKMLAIAQKRIEVLNKKEPQYYQETALKVIIVDDAWQILKNDYGIVLGRGVSVQIIGQGKVDRNIEGESYKAGEYFFRTWHFFEDYLSGTFSEDVKPVDFYGYGHGGRNHVIQADAKSALKGDFSFAK
jgi:hypothetical protein